MSSAAVVPNFKFGGGFRFKFISLEHLENVTRASALRKSAADSEPKSEPIFGIVNDSHSERGVHWHSLAMDTSTNPHHVDARCQCGLSTAVGTSASASTRDVQVRSDVTNENWPRGTRW